MTAPDRDGSRTPWIGGVPADVRLAALIPELVQRLVAAFADQVPLYASLPTEELAGDITAVVEDNLRGFARTLRTGVLPTREDLAGQVRSAARRAEEGVPLGAMLTAYHLGSRLASDALLAAAEPADLEAIREVNRLLLSQLQVVVAAVADAYVEEYRTLHGQEQAAKQAVLSALLDGRDPAAAARRAGLEPAAGYLVITLDLGEHPDEAKGGDTARFAARRKIHRVQAELDHHGRGQALHALSTHGGVSLVPVEDPAHALDGDWPRTRALVGRLADRAGVLVTAGVAVAGRGEGVPGAASESADILELVRVSGREPGAYRLADVLLDFQLSRPGPARDHLAGLLAPLERQPELLRTLLVFTEAGFSRRRAASLLHLHPNTVDYRLRRIAVLTGLDPTQPEHLPQLRAALVARHYG